MQPSILIVDDHSLFRTGLCLILSQSQESYKTLEASSVMEAVKFSDTTIDAIFLDIQMPGLNGLDGLKVLENRFPQVPVVVISASESPEDRRLAIERGAQGFLHKSASATDIFSCLASVLRGKTVDASLKSYQLKEEAMLPGHELSPRQLEVLSLLCQGKSNKLIARDLGLAENTVRVHVSAILSILDASSRTEASLIAQQKKIISLPPLS